MILKKFVQYFKNEMAEAMQTLHECSVDIAEIKKDKFHINHAVLGTINPAATGYDKNHNNNLTKRQLDCLFYLVKGMTIKEIAAMLSLSHRTIEHYIEAIKQKLECNSRSDLICRGLQMSEIKNKLS